MSLWKEWESGEVGLQENGIVAVAGVLERLGLSERDGIEVLIRMLAWIAADTGHGMEMVLWLGSEIQEIEEQMEQSERVLQ